MEEVKGRSIESQNNSTSRKTGFGPPKIAIFEEILGKTSWHSGIRVTKVL
jgi:hypothetical protein